MAQESYEELEFIPPSEILGETDSTTPTVIKIYLPGFKIGELKVTRVFGPEPQKIRIAGEKPREGNIWIRFTKEFFIPPDCDTAGEIKARFVGGILSVILPKKTASMQKADETKEMKESGQEQQQKGQKPTNGSVQDTENKKTEEPTAPKEKGKAGISEEVSKPEESKGETNTTSRASAQIVPPERKPSKPDQMTTGGDAKETREEASSEAVQGGSASDPPPPQPQEPQETNKKDEKQESGKPTNPQVNGEAVSEEVPNSEEPKSHTQQEKQPNEVKGATSETTTDDNKKEGGEPKNTVKRKGYECTFAEMRLRKRMKKLNLALMVLAGIGIGLCVKSMIRSYGGDADE